MTIVLDMGGVLMNHNMPECIARFTDILGEEQMKTILGLATNGEGTADSLMEQYERGDISVKRKHITDISNEIKRFEYNYKKIIAQMLTLIICAPILSFIFIITGIGLILAFLCVYFSDIQHLWSVATLMLMYASAIFYPMDIIPEPYYHYMILNPLFHNLLKNYYYNVSLFH